MEHSSTHMQKNTATDDSMSCARAPGRTKRFFYWKSCGGETTAHTAGRARSVEKGNRDALDLDAARVRGGHRCGLSRQWAIQDSRSTRRLRNCKCQKLDSKTTKRGAQVISVAAEPLSLYFFLSVAHQSTVTIGAVAGSLVARHDTQEARPALRGPLLESPTCCE